MYGDVSLSDGVIEYASFPEHPCLLALAAGDCTLLGPILVAKSAAAGCQDNIGVGEVLKEGRKAESIHAAGDYGGSMDHQPRPAAACKQCPYQKHHPPSCQNSWCRR